MTFTVRDASRLYGIENWGAGYFNVNAAGHLTVHPDRGEKGIDLYSIASRLKEKRLRFPVLLRFPQILASRVGDIFGAFERAITEFGYGNAYRGVFLIKVNQTREVVEELVTAGKGRGLGLEAGSKAELTIAPEARTALLELLGGDRLASRSEIRKLTTYARDKKRVELADVTAVVRSRSEASSPSVGPSAMYSPLCTRCRHMRASRTAAVICIV